jgi:hypothetical protein
MVFNKKLLPRNVNRYLPATLLLAGIVLCGPVALMRHRSSKSPKRRFLGAVPSREDECERVRNLPIWHNFANSPKLLQKPLDTPIPHVLIYTSLRKRFTPPSERQRNKKRLRCGKTCFAQINSAPSQLNRDDHITNTISVSVGGSTHASVWFYHL